MKGRETPRHSILWDPHKQHPFLQTKEGIQRKQYNLYHRPEPSRVSFSYLSDVAVLEGLWKEDNLGTCRLSMKLTNISFGSLRITRLHFPAENGLDHFLSDFPLQNLSFLRNGYQSWSTARSYRPHEKPLRPWFQLVSQVTSNMSNLPSNIPGMFSSEMYALIRNNEKEESFLVGQSAPFHQFFYIKFHLNKTHVNSSYLELIYDFGRKMIGPGETVELDNIIFARGAFNELEKTYVETVSRDMNIKKPVENFTGYGTWYYYFEKIKPADIRKNLSILKDRSVPVKTFQIDDGYQSHVGDWLSLKPDFKDQMKQLADEIREAGFMPGIWIAPFITNTKSELARIHPDYILKNEYGRKLTGGYNPTWAGNYYYGLDITNPRFEEYLRKVIRTMAHDWGFRFFKCDFLFGGCLRGAIHHQMELSRAEILRKGMEIIREEAGRDVVIEGCGMPFVPGVGTVDTMRVGPDTGPFWVKYTGKLLRTGSMMGVRNSIRNTFNRSMLHKHFWLNDPDCLMLRKSQTKLSPNERMSQINAIILSGGMLLISDNLSKLTEDEWSDFSIIQNLNEKCFNGEMTALDLMEKEVPEVIYNSAGYLGLFNMSGRKKNREYDLRLVPGHCLELEDVWTGNKREVSENITLKIDNMPGHSSVLFKIRQGE